MLMIVGTRRMGGPWPHACEGHQLCPLPLSGSEVKAVQDFSNFFSYKIKIKK